MDHPGTCRQTMTVVGRAGPVKSTVIFAMCAAGSMVVAWLGLSTGGPLALLLPAAGFIVAGVIAGLSLRQGKAMAAITTVGWVAGGISCLLALVSTQAYRAAAVMPGMAITCAVAWLAVGAVESELISRMPGRGRGSAAFRELPLRLGLWGFASGVIAGAAMMRGGNNDPIVVTLLGIAFVIPYAANGHALATLPPPESAGDGQV